MQGEFLIIHAESPYMAKKTSRLSINQSIKSEAKAKVRGPSSNRRYPSYWNAFLCSRYKIGRD
jgi:hypothetical protein